MTVDRGGVSPLTTRLLVHAPSRSRAGEVACWLAERGSGGLFEVVRVRKAGHAASRYPPDAYDDADFWLPEAC